AAMLDYHKHIQQTKCRGHGVTLQTVDFRKRRVTAECQRSQAENHTEDIVPSVKGATGQM
ncbi:MAG: hypothetical protein JWO52_6460, partial [Gammaproteobacteria bacterium]|nr:hypothetical protein [Gammaproteobacteria bacterium]